MVEKRIIKNINNSIPSSNKYKNIETKLDFNGFQNGTSPITKTKKPLKNIVLISAACVAIVVPLIIIPVTLSHKNNQVTLKPVSDEILSFYLKNSSFGSADIPEGTSVGGLYNTYKQRPEKMAELAQRKEIFNLKVENKIHCYYVTKEVLNAVNQLFVPPDDYMIPWRNLTAYGYGYYGFSEDLKAQELMEVEIDTDVEKIQTKIDNYYLLDAVRFYTDSSIDNYYWIDFVNYDIKEGLAIINASGLKDSYRYCSCTFTNPNKLREEEILIYNYNYVSVLDFHSFEITQEDDIEVVNETFRYIHIEDPYYYDELNDCIIRKTFVDSYGNRDAYDVMFAYQKLVKLFGF